MRWKPDTCDCVIVYESGDNNNPQGEWDFEETCARHTGDKVTKLDAVKTENHTKNFAHGAIVEAAKVSLTGQEKKMLGLLARVLGNEHGVIEIPDSVIPAEKHFNWKIADNGDVEFELQGFSAAEKANINAAIDAKVKPTPGLKLDRNKVKIK